MQRNPGVWEQYYWVKDNSVGKVWELATQITSAKFAIFASFSLLFQHLT